MYYQSFREQKKRGGDKAARARGEYFNAEDFRKVMSVFDNDLDEDVSPDAFPHPVKPIAKSTFEQYKAVLKCLHTEQVTRGVCGMTWDLIWQLPCQRLLKHVKERAPMIKKATYQEKVSGEFAPYTIVERYSEIEQALWEDSSNVSPRSINTNLRHRACCLYLTSGILRSESLHHAELSDFLCLKPPSKDTDIHPMFLLINRIAMGKTNHGKTLYGRATRHRDVRLCAVGAISTYLQYRMHCTKEFDNFTADDWLDNKKWFDIKFLVDINGSDFKTEMLNDSYGIHIKKILTKLSLSCSKLLHLGRNMGARILGMLEEESEEIRRMGQWNPSMFDNPKASGIQQ
jgi:hypothetical protein